MDLANAVVDTIDDAGGSACRLLYPDDMPLLEKVRTVARNLYGAADIAVENHVRDQLLALDAEYRHFPVCIAKTPYSFSADPALRGAPSGHLLPIREVRLSRGAEFVVVICGDILTMPGLPRHPASERIDIDAQGQITGLF